MSETIEDNKDKRMSLKTLAFLTLLQLVFSYMFMSGVVLEALGIQSVSSLFIWGYWLGLVMGLFFVLGLFGLVSRIIEKTLLKRRVSEAQIELTKRIIEGALVFSLGFVMLNGFLVEVLELRERLLTAQAMGWAWMIVAWFFALIGGLKLWNNLETLVRKWL